MKFNPATKELFTDSGELVKVLHCPHRMRWQQLTVGVGEPHRTCSRCDHRVLDTAVMSEAEVVAVVQADRSACLCVRAGQQDLTLLQPLAITGEEVTA